VSGSGPTVRYVCRACGATEPIATRAWRCRCGHHFALDATCRLDPARLAGRPPGLWRYREAIPLPAGVEPVTLGEPATPLLQLDLDGARPRLKLDYLLPTGSYKDRGATVLVSLLKHLGLDHVLEDSSGNAGSAIAAYCAAAGIDCDIYSPATASAGKLLQIAAYGATVHRIPGTREDVTAAALAAAERTYYASHYWNPFFNEGTKTVAFEAWEQLGQVPDVLVAPCGHGSVILGAAKGFAELRASGVTGHVPRIVAVQSAAVAPLHRMFHEGLDAVPEIPPSTTAAEGVATRRPLRWREILAAVRESRGTFVAVTETEIADALRWAARRGLFIEPTSAAAIAGYRRAVTGGSIGASETALVVLTGHGLKSPEKIAELLGTGGSR
jgi:threonine synthase